MVGLETTEKLLKLAQEYGATRIKMGDIEICMPEPVAPLAKFEPYTIVHPGIEPGPPAPKKPLDISDPLNDPATFTGGMPIYRERDK